MLKTIYAVTQNPSLRTLFAIFITAPVSIITPSPLVKTSALFFGALMILSVIRIAIIERRIGRRYISNITEISMLGMLTTGLAGYSTIENPWGISSGYILAGALIAFVLLLYETISRGMFMFHVLLKGQELYATERFVKILEKPASRWRDEINFVLQMAKGRSSAHEENARNILELSASIPGMNKKS